MSISETIGFDMDGVLTKHFNYTEERLLKVSNKDKCETKSLKRILETVELSLFPIYTPFIIITSRPVELKYLTLVWLLSNGITDFNHLVMPKKYLFGKERIEYKAKAINHFRLETYYEDENDILKGLIPLCPDTKIKSPHEALFDGTASYNRIIDRVFVM